MLSTQSLCTTRRRLLHWNRPSQLVVRYYLLRERRLQRLSCRDNTRKAAEVLVRLRTVREWRPYHHLQHNDTRTRCRTQVERPNTFSRLEWRGKAWEAVRFAFLLWQEMPLPRKLVISPDTYRLLDP